MQCYARGCNDSRICNASSYSVNWIHRNLPEKNRGELGGCRVCLSGEVNRLWIEHD